MTTNNYPASEVFSSQLFPLEAGFSINKISNSYQLLLSLSANKIKNQIRKDKLRGKSSDYINFTPNSNSSNNSDSHHSRFIFTLPYPLIKCNSDDNRGGYFFNCAIDHNRNSLTALSIQRFREKFLVLARWKPSINRDISREFSITAPGGSV